VAANSLLMIRANRRSTRPDWLQQQENDMDFAQTNWATVGFVNMAIGLVVFAVFAWRRQWTMGALLVGVIHLPIAFVNCAAPFRGFLDPTYVGYNFGLVHAAPGIEVGMFALSMLLGGLASACIIVLNRPGARNYFVVAFDAFVLLFMVPATLGEVAAKGMQSFRMEFGEYLQFGGLPAMLFELGLLAVPMIIGIFWAMRRAKE
jgi:hypothetical protein